MLPKPARALPRRASACPVKYTGGYLAPKVTLKTKTNASYVWASMAGKTLTEGEHYTVTYSNNKNKGKAKVTIKGMGIFKGTVTKTFKITK